MIRSWDLILSDDEDTSVDSSSQSRGHMGRDKGLSGHSEPGDTGIFPFVAHITLIGLLALSQLNYCKQRKKTRKKSQRYRNSWA